MPNRKISDNTNLLAAGLANDDLLHIVDVSQAADIDKNSKIEFSELVTRLGTELNEAQVSVSANDADTGFLATKIVGSASISVAEVNDGLSETLQIDFIGTTGGEDYFEANSVGTLPVAVGTDAVAIGPSASADGLNALAIGDTAVTGVGCTNSIAIGNSATVGPGATDAIAIGDGTSVTVAGGIAIGEGAACTTLRSLNIGNVISSGIGTDNVLIGNGVGGFAGNAQNVTIGSGASTDSGASDAVSIGFEAFVPTNNSVAIGSQSIIGSTGTGSVAIGGDSQANRGGVAVGGNAIATGTDCVQLGAGTNTLAETLNFGTRRIATIGSGIIADNAAGAPVSSPTDGHLYIDTTDNVFYFRSSSLWIPINNRTILTADTTIYVDGTTGNDLNDGFSPGAPLLTIQRAVDLVTELDPREHNVTIQLADGTYNQGQIILKRSIVSTPVTIQGNAGNNAAVIVDNNDGAPNISTFDNFGTVTGWTLKDFTVGNSGAATVGGNFGIRSITGYFGLNNMRFLGTGNTTAIQIAQQAIATASGQTIDVAGTFLDFINCTQSASISFDGSTINFAGGAGASNNYLSISLCSSYTQFGLSTTGSFTGTRYLASSNSAIRSTNGLDTDIPGNAAGTLATGAVLTN